MTTYFAPSYAPVETERFARLGVAAEHMRRLDLVKLVAPPALDTGLLSGLHSPTYLRDFASGTEPLASSLGIRWSIPVRDACYAMLAGQLAAVDHALRHRVCLNLACGFHHAVAERGSAYCALNGLALIAHVRPELRVFVIDCDEHGGNGTESFTQTLPNLYQASIFGTRFGCLGGERSWAYHVQGAQAFQQYMSALDEVRARVAALKPDLILYQAGVDCHQDDPKSRARISAAQMYERDLHVFNTAMELGIPLVFVVAGGYQAPEILAELNASTVRAALAVYANACSSA